VKIRMIKSIVLFMLVLSAGWTGLAQVASHAPVVIQAPSQDNTATVFHPVGRPVVRVNGTILTDSDLVREMYQIFPYARVHNGFPKGMEDGIRDGAMKMMIFEELVYQEARRTNMTVPPADLARAVAQFRSQFHTQEQYEQFLQHDFNGSPHLLQVKVERSLLIDKMLKQEVEDKSVVTVADAKAYFDKHPEKFNKPESFTFQSISIIPPQNATPAQLLEARRRAATALQKAKATKSYDEFGQLAENMSDDDFHVMMGEHPTADRSKLPPVVVKALLGMQPGQVSDLIEFDANDLTILRLKEHLPAGLPKFETIKDALREQLAKDKSEELRSALASRLSKKAKIEKA